MIKKFKEKQMCKGFGKMKAIKDREREREWENERDGNQRKERQKEKWQIDLQTRYEDKKKG